MCIVFVTCLTEGAREALSTPKHPKLTKVKNNPFLAPHDRPFFKEAIWKARFFYSPPLKGVMLKLPILVGEGIKGESLFRGARKERSFSRQSTSARTSERVARTDRAHPSL